MPKPNFQDLEIQCWEHAGKLGMAGREICLFQTANDHGERLLRALDELLAEGGVSKRTATFKPSGRKREIDTLRLLFVPPRADLCVLSITREKATATIEMTAAGLQLLREAIATWCQGGEDFGVSPQHANLAKRELRVLDQASRELWFWGPTMEP
ncbi:MAG: hypothetical protein KJ000_17460 [Pirellulaceae bacterium]|nr:hypothetical protein [Pirellulaceae bacterium]